MLTRALIVLLVILNLGVGLWWALRDPTAPEPPAAPAPGVERLRLVDEASPPPAQVGAASMASAPSHCYELGPFPAVTDAEAAAARLQPAPLHWQVRTGWAGTPEQWRVFLPPFATVAEAESAAAQVAAAGAEDFYVIRDGAGARSVALGLYRAEEAARARAGALQALGIAAQVEPLGAGPAEYWLEVAAAEAPEAEQARAAAGADRHASVSCEVLVPATPTAVAPEP